jgi:hypothetical protein
MRKERLDSGGFGHNQDRKRGLAPPSFALPRLLKEQSFEHQLRCERPSTVEHSYLRICVSAPARGHESASELGRKMPDRCARACRQGSTEHRAEGRQHTRSPPTRHTTEDIVGSERAVQEE